jgi:hypothetical protein
VQLSITGHIITLYRQEQTLYDQLYDGWQGSELCDATSHERAIPRSYISCLKWTGYFQMALEVFSHLYQFLRLVDGQIFCRIWDLSCFLEITSHIYLWSTHCSIMLLKNLLLILSSNSLWTTFLANKIQCQLAETYVFCLLYKTAKLCGHIMHTIIDICIQRHQPDYLSDPGPLMGIVTSLQSCHVERKHVKAPHCVFQTQHLC